MKREKDDEEGNNQMAYKLFEEVVLRKDIPEKRLRRGDVTTIVEHHLVSSRFMNRFLKKP